MEYLCEFCGLKYSHEYDCPNRRDSEGGDACGSVHDSAGPKDIAQGQQP